MKTIFYLGVVSICTLFFSCSDKQTENGFEYNQAFIMKYGTTYTHNTDNLTIEIKSIQEERCPKDVDCIWEGRAFITFIVNNSEEITSTIKGLCFDLASTCGKQIEGMTIKIHAMLLNPYKDKESVIIPLEDYRCTLVVSKK